jgi:hypothetical protein
MKIILFIIKLLKLFVGTIIMKSCMVAVHTVC